METFYNKSKLMTGDRALSNLPHELKMKNLSKPMLISEKMEAYTPFYKAVKKAFDNDKLKIVGIEVCSSKKANAETINEYVETYKECGADSIIAIGRDAAISIAKLMKLALEQGAKDVRNIEKIVEPTVSTPLFVIPVFYGSGDEGRGIAKCYDNDVCYEYVSDTLLPDAIILDGDMVFSPSGSVMASTIMYILASSIIAYTNKDSGVMTRVTAMASIEGICKTVQNSEFKKRPNSFGQYIATSNVLAGIAIGQVRHDDLSVMTDIVSRHLRVPYSKMYSMLFPHYYEQIVDSDDISYMEVLLPIIGEERYALTPINKRAEEVVKRIRTLIDYLERATSFRYNLSDYKMRRDDIPMLVDKMVECGIDRDIARITLERTY